MSLSSDSSLTIGGKTLFDFLDMVATNIMLPVGSLLMCIYAGWVAPRSLMIRQFTNDGTLRGHLSGFIMFCIKYVAPPAIIAIFVTTFL